MSKMATSLLIAVLSLLVLGVRANHVGVSSLVKYSIMHTTLVTFLIFYIFQTTPTTIKHHPICFPSNVLKSSHDFRRRSSLALF